MPVVYNCYDFNETGQISIDELTLALRSTLTGLCKLSTNIVCPTELALEDVALHAFHKAQKTSPDDFLTLPEFLKFADTTPEMTSWVDYFDCPSEVVEEMDGEENAEQDLGVTVVPVTASTDELVENAARKRDWTIQMDARAPVFTPDALVPLKPWQNVVANAAPSAPPPINPASPAASLELEWVYGFNSDLRDALRYISPAEVVFPAGAVVVIYDTIEHKQRFASHHSGAVQSLAVHPVNSRIIASAEAGPSPKIVVWHADATETTLSVVRGFHQVGVSHLEWMPNGRTLISIGQDEFHCVAVYQWELSPQSQSAPLQTVDWQKPPVLVFADRCGREPVYACAVLNNNQFVTSGRRNLFFWLRESNDRYTSDHAVFYKRRGVLGRKTKIQMLLSLTALPSDPNAVLAGTARGQILLFEGRNCVKVIHAHAAAINALCAFPGGMLSAGADGKVRLWSKRMEPGAQFDMEALGSVSSRVRSITSSPDGGAKLLVGTSGAEIFEMAASDGSNLHFGAMLSGHFAFELHGLDAHPIKKEFCTVGDDRTVRIWDMASHKQLRMALLDAPSRSCAYSPDGSLIAVGQGAAVEEDASSPVRWTTKQQAKLINPNKQGAFAVLSESALAVKYEAKDSKKYIRTVKFAGDGLTLAVGSNDCFIYAYNTEDWASKGKCKARDTALVLSRFDFSTTGEYIMANADNKGEMVFFEAASGVEITRIATLKDVDWLTCSCPYGWSVQSAWPSVDSAQAYEISAVDRSNRNDSRASVSSLLVSGDTFGTLRLFRYPCVAPNSNFQRFQGASSVISNVRFSADNTSVIATSRDDRCIFQWHVEAEDHDPIADGGATAPTEYEYQANSDDEVEMSNGVSRTPFEEAAGLGDFAVDLLHQCFTDSASDAVHADHHTSPAAPLPIKPWVSSSIAPTSAPDEKDLELSAVPSDSLELEWVYGYRCHDARNNVFLSRAKGLLVYPAAKVVVVLDTKLWLQKHFTQHSDEVTSLATYFGTKPSKKRPDTSASDGGSSSGTKSAAITLEVAASGQMGKFPVIHVWRIDSLDVLVSLRGFHRQGIAELRFNSTGTLLASVGLDDGNSLAVYDWQNGELLACSSSNAFGRTLGMSFQQDDENETVTGARLVTVGVKAVTFWRLSDSGTTSLVKKEAVFGKKGMMQTYLSAVFCGKDAIVGTTSGDLYRFKGIDLNSVVPAHTRGVAALYCVPAPPHSIVSGGKDGIVKLWTSDLECLSEFAEFNSARHPIRSVFLDFGRNTLVVGTRGTSIHQLSSLDGTAIVAKVSDGTEIPALPGHFRNELHGLSVCSAKERFCTTGDDGMLRVWDLPRHYQILSHELETSSRACAYSQDGSYIAVGLGSGGTGRRHKKDGTLLVFEDRGQSIELIYETRDTKQSISVLRFSPDDQSLVVGSHDNSIYIYDVSSNFTKRAVFSKHKSTVTQIDITSDSQYIRSNCGGFELLFADITTGSHVASATALRDQQWATCSTIYNWFNQGVWPSSNPTAAKHLQITASTASSIRDAGASSSETEESIVVAGSTHGTLTMFKYPCFVKGAGYKTYFGHTGAIARVELAGRGGASTHCISIGSTDRCILQWRKKRAGADGAAAPTIMNAAPVEDDPDMTVEGLFLPEAFINMPSADEVKPFGSSLVAPFQPPLEPADGEGDAAKCAFELEHVFGFRAFDVRNNAVYAKAKHVVFHSGCLGVRYDRRSHAQAFYSGHVRPIVSLAATRDGGLVATGEICSESFTHERPRIHIWEPASCARVAVLSAFHVKAVGYLAFNASSSLLASIGQDEFHSLAVYRSNSGLWLDGAMIASSRTTRSSVFFVTFIEDTAAGFHLVSGGVDHVTFWKLDSPGLVATTGVFGSRGSRQSVLCGASMGSLVVTGCASGHLYVWESSVVARAVPAHDGAVYALHAAALGCVSGGRDGHVKFWSRSCAPLADFDLAAASSTPYVAVRSVCWDVAEDRVLIGSRSGELHELSRLTGSTSLVVESHFGANCELHGLSAHPTKAELVATAGEDQTVRVWNLATREVVSKTTLDGTLRAIAYSADGAWLAVGFGATNEAVSGHKHGAIAVLDASTLEVIHEGRDSKQSVLDVRFSPDQTLLAVASADHAVYFYSPLDSFALRFKFAKAAARVTHIDFSVDSSALRLSTEAFELLFVRTLDGSQVTAPSSLKDVVWASHGCVFSWEAQGVWDPARPEEYVYALARANSRPLLAAATNTGELRIYNLPVLSRHAEQHALRGHSLLVSNVVFTSDDSRIVSIGAHDKSLLVWRVDG